MCGPSPSAPAPLHAVVPAFYPTARFVWGDTTPSGLWSGHWTAPLAGVWLGARGGRCGGVRGGATESRGSLAKDDPPAPLATEWVGRRGGSPHPLCRDRVDDAPVTDTRGPACGGCPRPSGLSDARATRSGAQGSRGPCAARIGRHRRRGRHSPPAPHTRGHPQPAPSRSPPERRHTGGTERLNT